MRRLLRIRSIQILGLGMAAGVFVYPAGDSLIPLGPHTDFHMGLVGTWSLFVLGVMCLSLAGLLCWEDYKTVREPQKSGGK